MDFHAVKEAFENRVSDTYFFYRIKICFYKLLF